MEQQKEIDNKGAAFIDTIVALKNGAVLQQAGERLNALIGAVIQTARPGSIVITFKVVPAAGSMPGDTEQVSVEAEIREKLPQPSLGRTLFFTGEGNLLSRQHPAQLAINLEMPKKP